MPLFKTKRNAFNWIKNGQKTIDVRKGKAWRGNIAVIQCGTDILRLPITRKETGEITQIVREDNYKAIIPTAKSLEEVIEYLKIMYKNLDGTFTAYYLKVEEGEK